MNTTNQTTFALTPAEMRLVQAYRLLDLKVAGIAMRAMIAWSRNPELRAAPAKPALRLIAGGAA